MLLLFWRGTTLLSGETTGVANTDSRLGRELILREGDAWGRALTEASIASLRQFLDATASGHAFTSSVVDVVRELVGEASGTSSTGAQRNLARPRIVRISIRADGAADVGLETMEVLH